MLIRLVRMPLVCNKKKKHRYVRMLKLAHFGNRFLPLMVDCDMPILHGLIPKLAQNAFSVRQSDSCAISANFGLIPKLAQNAFSVLQSDSCAISANCGTKYNIIIPMLVEYDIPILD